MVDLGFFHDLMLVVSTGINRGPTGAIGELAPPNDVDTAFYLIHLSLVEGSHETLNFEFIECKFFLCHTIRSFSSS